MPRIFFACDCHGSVTVFRKMLQVHSAYNCDIIMMCGDLTGKALVPIIQEGENLWWTAPWGKKEVYKSKEQVEQAKKNFEKRGFYCYFTNPKELEELQANPDKVQKIFHAMMLDRLREWVNEIDEKIPSNVTFILSPGNDDVLEIDEIIKSSEKIVYPIGRVIEITEIHKMISCEWVNTTPWKTPRECSDEELKLKLEEEFKKVDDYSNLICNFHTPPFGTRLDLAPKIDEKLRVRVRFGTPDMIHVGSRAVREMFEKYQPLLGLHGHIHESAGIEYIGRTLCVNPGSAYIQGILNAFIIDLPLKNGKIKIFNVSA